MEKPTEDKVMHHFAGIFLVTESGKVVGQHRDDKPHIDHPNKLGTFGGAVEDGEDPLSAAWRELTQEETNLKIDKKDIHHLLDDVDWRDLTKEWEARHFYYAKIKDEDLADLQVYEGRGWGYINSPNDPDLIELWRPATRRLFDALGLAEDPA